MKRTVLLLFLSILFINLSSAQSVKDIFNRLEKIERDVRSLKSSSSNTAQKESEPVDLSTIQNDIKQIQEDLLKIENELAQPDTLIEKLIASLHNLEMNIKSLENQFHEAQKEEAEEEEEKDFDRWNIRGSLDLDVWANNKGDVYNNDYSKIWIENYLTKDVYITLGVKISEGSIPAGTGLPDDRFPYFKYNGIYLTWKNAFNSIDKLTFGDHEYKKGKFKYYGQKLHGMINPGRYIRGVGLKQSFNDVAVGMYLGTEQKFDEDIALAAYVKVPIAEEHSVEGSMAFDFQQKSPYTDYTLGATYLGKAGHLDLKLDLSYKGKSSSNDDIEAPEPSLGLLFEPELTITDNSSIAFTVYYQNDEDDINGGKFDDFFAYTEPYVGINDYVGFGLPIEFHDPDSDTDDDESIWVVPTMYIYPTDKTSVWVWGMLSKPVDSEHDPEYSVGIELILKLKSK